MSEAVTRATINDPRLVAVVNAIADDEARHMTRSVVVARGIERLQPLIEGDESHAEQCRRENASALILMANGSTPTQVARRMSPRNPSKHHMYAQRFRRLLREKK
jgi:hypothetical protein